ncbi:MAG: hypothetical protein [Circular genetic element sp.]|nr:MAG: hypothetical protein [Circular genetic element sp.]
MRLYDKISDPFDRHQFIRGQKVYDEGGSTGFRDFLKAELYSDLTTISIVGSAMLFPGTLTQITRLPTLLRGGMSLRTAYSVYGGHLTPFPGLGVIVAGELYSRFKESRGGRDAKPGSSDPPVGPGRRPRPPIKPSRPGSPGRTSKPFWTNGKPKCKKGFRYDFKRKLCVKI